MNIFLQYIPAVSACISATAVAVTAIFAVKGLRAWRTQLTGKRRFEVAEQTLQAFEEARSVIEYARNGSAWAGEGSTRPRPAEGGENDDQRRHRDALYTPAERLNAAEAKFADLRKAWVLFEIHFPDGPIDAIRAVFEIRGAVYIAVRQLLDEDGRSSYLRGEVRAQERDRLGRARDTIYNGLIKEDPTTIKLTNAAQQLKSFCQAHIFVDDSIF